MRKNSPASEIYYCQECFNTGCRCGGIGYTCDGCCGCINDQTLKCILCGSQVGTYDEHLCDSCYSTIEE